MSIIFIPLSQHPNVNECSAVAIWQDSITNDAVFQAGAGFVARVGSTGAVFANLFASLVDAQAALMKYRVPGYSPLPD